MKHNFRILIGMLALAIPLCLNAQDINQKVDDLQGKVNRMPKISGFVQGLYQANLSDEGELSSNTFRMRRVRLSADGTLFKGLTYKVQADFLNSPVLVDAYMKYKVCNEFAIQVGQFKTPFSIESPINPVNLEIFDYGENVQKLGGYSDVCGVGKLGRDIGIMATGSLFPVELQNGEKFGLVDYSLGVFNGNGTNVIDNNNRKDVVGRLEIHPMLKDLTLSGSYYYGFYKGSNDLDNVPNGDKNFGHGARNRWTAGLQYNDGDLVVRGEYISGLTGYQAGVTDNAGNPFTEEKTLSSNGYYGVAGYNFKVGKDGSQKLMPVVRYEHFAKDVTVDDGGTNWYTVGLSYWPLKSVNLKLDYSLIQPEAGNNSHRVVAMLNYKF